MYSTEYDIHTRCNLIIVKYLRNRNNIVDNTATVNNISGIVLSSILRKIELVVKKISNTDHSISFDNRAILNIVNTFKYGEDTSGINLNVTNNLFCMTYRMEGTIFECDQCPISKYGATPHTDECYQADSRYEYVKKSWNKKAHDSAIDELVQLDKSFINELRKTLGLTADTSETKDIGTMCSDEPNYNDINFEEFTKIYNDTFSVSDVTLDTIKAILSKLGYVIPGSEVPYDVFISDGIFNRNTLANTKGRGSYYTTTITTKGVELLMPLIRKQLLK